MTLILNKITDPRDSLEKAKRYELVKFAHEHGHTQITTEMPAILIRKYLRSQGLTNIKIPHRPLGQPPKDSPNALQSTAVDEKNVPTFDAEDDLARQFGLDMTDKTDLIEPEKPKPEKKNTNIIHEIAKLRTKCKELGITMNVHDTRATLKAKLKAHVNGEVAS